MSLIFLLFTFLFLLELAAANIMPNVSLSCTALFSGCKYQGHFLIFASFSAYIYSVLTFQINTLTAIKQEMP